MADAATRRTENTEPNDPKEQASGEGSGANTVRWLPSRKTLAIMLVCSLIANGAILLVSYSRMIQPGTPIPAEVSLGDFQYRANPLGQRGIADTEFSLHVALLNDLRRPAQDRVAARRQRIRQAVEEVLRQAHASDFEDPILGDLKRQIQERINAVLEMRAVDEVIVTDLVVQSSLPPATEGAPTAENTALWKPPSR